MGFGYFFIFCLFLMYFLKKIHTNSGNERDKYKTEKKKIIKVEEDNIGT